MNLIGESIIVGLICTFVGTIVFTTVAKINPLKLPKNTKYEKHTKSWMIQLIISLFLTGFLGHLFFEVTGMNKYLHKWTGVWLW